jgi:predicted phosphoribosyltransferase
MPKVRDILNHASVEVASRKRICHRKRNDHSVLAGQPCLVVKDGATMGSKNYCATCSAEILDQAKAKIASLEKQLSK